MVLCLSPSCVKGGSKLKGFRNCTPPKWTASFHFPQTSLVLSLVLLLLTFYPNEMNFPFLYFAGLELVYAMCASTPQSVTAGIYNLMISIGSFFSIIILTVTAHYNWYPLHIAGDTDYLHSDEAKYYYWVLSGIVILGIFVLVAIGYCYDIGLRNYYQHHHHHHYTVQADSHVCVDSNDDYNMDRNFSSAENAAYTEI